MKWSAAIVLLLLANGIAAQAQEPVPLARGNVPGEPHHHLKIENEYVRVYYVEVPPHEATQLHQHDHDYIYVSLGDSEVVNAVLDKPEVHLMLRDGETHFMRGGFAHVARNLADTPFRNITIELLQPQGKVQNWCDRVVPDAPTDCSAASHEGAKQLPSFRTEEIKVFSDNLESRASLKWKAFSAALIVVFYDSQVKVLFGKQSEKLGAGQILWIPSNADQSAREIVFKNAQRDESRVVLILFEDTTRKKKP